MADPDHSTKWCWKCASHLPLPAFGRNRARKDGLNAVCKPCANALSKATRDADRERARAWSRSYYARNPEKRREAVKRSAAKNPERVAATKRASDARRRERLRADGLSAALSQQKYARNPGPARRAAKKWRLGNLDKARTYTRNRRARRKAAAGTHTPAEIAEIFKAQKSRCAYCRVKLTKHAVDHVVSLKKGGTNDRRNLQITCIPCNSRKSDQDPIDFARKLGRLL